MVAGQPTVEPAKALLPKAKTYCYPNPVGAGEGAHLRFVLSADARVELAVFDALGTRVTRRRVAGLAAGEHEIAWAVDDYQSGLYICRLEATGSGGRQGEVLVKMAVSR